jgi:futalosine hydrolase
MPGFLVVSATRTEVEPLLSYFSITVNEDAGLFTRAVDPENVAVLITGVGMVNTAYMLGKYSEKDFDYVINAGVCGAFDRSLKQGDVVCIQSDVLSEMGAEDDDKFILYHDLNLGGTNVYKAKSERFEKAVGALRKVSAVTVNKVHGNEASIEKAMELYHPQVESMEGAAFFRGCEAWANYIQLRAVSNYVEKRDKSKWRMKEAIENLNKELIRIIEGLSK